jgi:oligopeptidase B
MRELRLALPLAALLAFALLGPGCALPPPPEHPSAEATTLQPPVAPREPHTTTLHGDTLVDHYYWLRNKGAPEVESYLHAERAYAEAYMQPTRALQQTLYEEMLARIQQTDMSVPVYERGYWYYTRTGEGLQYPIHSRARGTPDAPEEVILDLNRLATGRTYLGVLDHRVSPDGNLLAYATDETGFRQYTLRVEDLRNGEPAAVAIPRVTSFEWGEDGRTLLYSVEHPQTKRSCQVYRHVPGESRHELLYEEKDERFNVSVRKSRDREMLFIVATSHTTSEVRFLPASQPATAPRLVAAREPGHQYFVDHRPGEFWIRTNDRGANFRLVTAPEDDPSRARWHEVVAHREQVMLEGVDLFRDFHVLLEREAGLPQLRVTTLADGRSQRIEFPEAAFDVWPESNPEFDAPAYRLSYQSPITPRSIYDYDPATGSRTLRKQDEVPGGFDPSRYRVELTEATAGDSVKIPVWLLMRKDLVRDGRNPALLHAYGAYGASSTAYFDSEIFSLVDRGVVYAVAYVRGGGELGKHWHESGRMLAKRNTFTDFIAAAEHLIDERHTGKQRLAITGRSAGGLLMGAVTNMRPDLFRLVIAEVPFVEAVNSMLDPSLPLVVGEFEEWGNPRIETEYRYLLGYSPYDNLAAKDYPAMLVTSSYYDSQVMYWEPAKYVARLRHLKTDRNPLLFRIDMQPAGHGGRSGRFDRLRERAFTYAFLLWQLGVERVP